MASKLPNLLKPAEFQKFCLLNDKSAFGFTFKMQHHYFLADGTTACHLSVHLSVMLCIVTLRTGVGG